MGILDSNQQQQQQQIVPAQRAARMIKQNARSTFENLLSQYKQGTELFWSHPSGSTPADIASYLGTDAAEIFNLHYALGQFLETLKPGCTVEINSLIPWDTFNLNQDGTVTITQPQT